MLAVAGRATSPEMAIEWREANAETIPFPDATFDVILCQFGLQFVPDKLKAACEMCRVLVPGGRLAINLPGPAPEVFTIIDAALARHLGEDAAGFVRAVFSLHDPSDIRRLLDAAGFRGSPSGEARTVPRAFGCRLLVGVRPAPRSPSSPRKPVTSVAHAWNATS